jgi:cellulose biosynthesis protein BcsQ
LSFSIAVAGKGGTGKTTLTALGIRYLKRKGLAPILAIDADANANLGESTGLEPAQTVDSIVATFVPCDEMIQRNDFERRALLDLPDESKAVHAISSLMPMILSKEPFLKGAKK